MVQTSTCIVCNCSWAGSISNTVRCMRCIEMLPALRKGWALKRLPTQPQRATRMVEAGLWMVLPGLAWRDLKSVIGENATDVVETTLGAPLTSRTCANECPCRSLRQISKQRLNVSVWSSGRPLGPSVHADHAVSGFMQYLFLCARSGCPAPVASNSLRHERHGVFDFKTFFPSKNRKNIQII